MKKPSRFVEAGDTPAEHQNLMQRLFERWFMGAPKEEELANRRKIENRRMSGVVHDGRFITHVEETRREVAEEERERRDEDIPSWSPPSGRTIE